MTKNTRRSGNKINLSAKTARKVRAAIARANMPPLPVDGHKIRLQKLAKARKAAQQAGAVQDHEATAKGPDEGIALREFGKPSRAGRSTTYVIVVFEGEKFSQFVAENEIVMSTILADSFTASLAKFTNEEQKKAKSISFAQQSVPDRCEQQMHRTEASKDPSFSSVRVSRDVRIIIHATV
ncbi:MAG: hypothetical protein K0M49_16965 [Arenimonas sp.]|nr:hypothetical protein [Rhizobium sp.]MBW8447315.1 hypothetical protein [Arenimonas sp.]